MIYWNFPTIKINDYKERSQIGFKETETEAGRPYRIELYKSPNDIVSGSFIVSGYDFKRFKIFYKYTTKQGGLPFLYKDCFNGDFRECSFIGVPQAQALSNDLFNVSITLTMKPFDNTDIMAKIIIGNLFNALNEVVPDATMTLDSSFNVTTGQEIYPAEVGKPYTLTSNYKQSLNFSLSEGETKTVGFAGQGDGSDYLKNGIPVLVANIPTWIKSPIELNSSNDDNKEFLQSAETGSEDLITYINIDLDAYIVVFELPILQPIALNDGTGDIQQSENTDVLLYSEENVFAKEAISSGDTVKINLPVGKYVIAFSYTEQINVDNLLQQETITVKSGTVFYKTYV